MKNRLKYIAGMAVCTCCTLSAVNMYCTGGYEIIVEGKSIGYVDDAADYSEVVEMINERVVPLYGEEAAFDKEVEFVGAFVAREELASKKELFENVAELSEYMTKACVIKINGETEIAFNDELEAKMVIDSLLKQFSRPEAVTRLADTLEYKSEFVRVADVYTVQEGLDYIIENNLIRVSSVETISYYEAVSPGRIEQPNDTMYKGSVEIISEGAAGENLVTADVEYINGVEAQTTVTSEIVVTKPVDEVVRVGTKEVPPGMGTDEFIAPAEGRFTSGFGARWGRTHRGIDIASAVGTTISAADGGTVAFAGSNSSYGLYIVIDHKNGYETYYAHCSKLCVRQGDVVQKGQKIAEMGNTGNSTGPHCHFEIHYNGELKNPTDYVSVN